MEEHPQLREAVLSWLQQARSLLPTPQAITDVALAVLPQWEALEEAVSAAAPITEHRDLYAKVDGDWIPSYRALLGESGLGDATRLIAQGTEVPEAEVADSFVAFCTGPAPAAEDWMLLNADFPEGTRIPLGCYTLQTFTPDELRQMGPMPTIHGLRPGALDLGLLAGAPFIHAPDPDHKPTRGIHWFGYRGPRPEAQHWQALLPLILWSSEPLRVDAVFDVARGRRFGLRPGDIPTTIRIYEDRHGREEEVEVRDTTSSLVTPADLPGLTAFCAAMTAKIDGVMAGATSGRRVPKRRARRLERAARHLLRAYQRTFADHGVWEQEADELHLDYVIALEALMISPIDEDHEGIAKNIRTRASALFLTPAHRERAETVVQRAYKARSTYVHGDVIKDQTEREKLDELRTLRRLTLQVILRWLVLTPSDTGDLAPLLDTAASGTEHERLIDEPLRAFFTASPPRKLPSDITPA
ncbi:hypothetical protein ACWGI8_03210 [Streptomyces sp. NPDC054841]